MVVSSTVAAEALPVAIERAYLEHGISLDRVLTYGGICYIGLVPAAIYHRDCMSAIIICTSFVIRNTPSLSNPSLTAQHPLDIRQSASLDLISLPLFLTKRQAHQLSFVLLDVENGVLDRTLDHQAKNAAVLRLPKPVHTIYGLILDRRSPPTIRKEDLVRTGEVQADGANAKRCQHDRGVVIVLKGMKRLISAARGHSTVDAAELVAFFLKAGLDEVKESRPLAEDYRLIFPGLGRGEDGHHRFELAA